MKLTRWITATAGATALLGMVALSGPAVWAQDATPEAEAAAVPRPVHIHSGTCNELGEVVVPLTDLTAPEGERVGQRRAALAETSFTTVPMTLEAILAEDHAINAHLSADEIGTYIACGELGGVLTPTGELVIGLSEVDNSGFAGIAFLSPGADGASTDVSVFIAESGRGRGGGDEAQAADTAGSEAADEADAPTDGADAAPSPMADMEGMEGDAMMAGEQVPVSLTEFSIDMPTTLPAGEVSFAVTNNGTITHSFEIESANLEEELEAPLEPGQSAILTVELSPGTYEVYCPIGNHAESGMRTEVTVS